MRAIIKFIILLFAVNASGVFAETWVRGSATVLQASGGVTINVPIEGMSYESFDQPVYFPGIFSVRAGPGGSLLLHTSNHLTLAFNGEGVFSVERFEGVMGVESESANQLVETQNRMILSLRRGELFIDTRSLAEDSKFVVETPLGRISCEKAILQIKIDFDYRSSIYDFTISSAAGTVRFNDLRKEVYTIYAGQRISGAGSYVAPAVEVGDQTDEIRENFEVFLTDLDELDVDAIDRAKLLSFTRVLPHFKVTTSPDLSTGTLRSSTKRPRVIEFAPRAENISPFRAEIKPPSNYQIDIF